MWMIRCLRMRMSRLVMQMMKCWMVRVWLIRYRLIRIENSWDSHFVMSCRKGNGVISIVRLTHSKIPGGEHSLTNVTSSLSVTPVPYVLTLCPNWATHPMLRHMHHFPLPYPYPEPIHLNTLTPTSWELEPSVDKELTKHISGLCIPTLSSGWPSLLLHALGAEKDNLRQNLICAYFLTRSQICDLTPNVLLALNNLVVLGYPSTHLDPAKHGYCLRIVSPLGILFRCEARFDWHRVG